MARERGREREREREWGRGLSVPSEAPPGQPLPAAAAPPAARGLVPVCALLVLPLGLEGLVRKPLRPIED